MNRRYLMQVKTVQGSTYIFEVFLRVTNHTGQAEKNLLGPAGIRTRDLRFTSPMLYQLSCRSRLGAGRQMMVLGLFDISKQNLVSSISRQ